MSSAMLKNSVWAAMNYTPPRGRCNHKTSLVSPACPCLRFMLHPVKAASSFECDGCGHHASFHSLENPAEDAIRQKWSEEEAQAKEQQAAVGANKKRKMLAQNSVKDDERIVVLDDVEGRDGNLVRASRSKKS
ncbi:hypothetical protein WHR41_08834 [Cladosporium halotolerans]|uniref:Uncharacterized protein n=1 Tax=Cladosporium halotolerans TaxID=1052096 RepID=A0AB34KFX0_9PEZI